MKAQPPKANEADLAEEPIAPETRKGSKLPFDPLRLVDGLARNWVRIAITGILCALIGLGGAVYHYRDAYTASLQLIRQEPPNAFRVSEIGESFKPRMMAVPTLISIMRSPSLVQRAAEGMGGKITPGMLLAGLNLAPERNTDLIRVEFKTFASANVASLALNQYAQQVVDFTRDMQSEEAATVAGFLQQQIARTDEDINKVNAEMLAYGREANLLNPDKEFDAYLRKQCDLELKYETTRIESETIGLRIANGEAALAKNSPGTAALQSARDVMGSMLAKFTPENPIVKEQQAKVHALEKQVSDAPPQATEFPQASDGGVATNLFLELVQLRGMQQSLIEQVKQLEGVRATVAKQLSALPEKQVHLARIQARRQSLETGRVLLDNRLREARLFMQNPIGYYRILAPSAPEDVMVLTRSKKVLLLILLGLFGGMSIAAALSVYRSTFDGRVRTAADLRRVTGLDTFASRPSTVVHPLQRENWAFRTWTSMRGRLDVTERGGSVGILSREPGVATRWVADFAEAAHHRGQKVICISSLHEDAIELADALEVPGSVIKAFEDGNPVHLYIGENFTWGAQARGRWHRAVQLWQEKVDAIVLLEITAPGESESVLLCERLPHILLVTESGGSSASELVELLAPYRDTGCNISGAALGGPPALRPDWLSRKFAQTAAMLGILATMSFSATAAESASTRAKPAQPVWLKHFTLGAGDGFNLGVYGHPELSRGEVYVAADGRLNYLQAQGVVAAGLTVDELRERLNTELAKYYQHAQVLISPIAFKSKRVFMLGKVVMKGALVLDRPLTVLEAVAEAGGIETGLYRGNTVELADLPRSLLVRKGRRIPVNFERLFNEGDMSQNIFLEPEDYLYFPSGSTNQIYVFGSVRNPGTQGLTAQATLISVIGSAGSFTEKAWRKKVLIVRGSLTKPQPITINVEDILAGRAQDFPIEPFDIIYVSDSPWSKVEQLLETAANAFVQAAVASWTGANIGPLLTRPILPQL